MSNLVEFLLKDGTKLYIEADVGACVHKPQSPLPSDESNPFVQVGRAGKDLTETATETFEQAMEALRPATTAILESLRALSPDTCMVEFGLKVSVGAFVFITAGGDANFKVSMTWNKAQK